MYLSGYASLLREQPLPDVYFSLGESITVVLGPNDSGKTTLLKELTEELNTGAGNGVFYAKLTRAELNSLVAERMSRSAASKRDRVDRLRERGSDLIDTSVGERQEEIDRAESLANSPEPAMAFLGLEAEERSIEASLVSRLATSNVIAFTPSQEALELFEGPSVINWCVDLSEASSEEVEAAAEFLERDRSSLTRRLCYSLQRRGAPIPMLAIASIYQPVLPVRVPLEFSLVARALDDAITDVLKVLRRGEGHEEFQPPHPYDPDPEESTADPWVTISPPGWRMEWYEHAQAVCAKAAAAAQRLLPEFVAERYRIVLGIHDLRHWSAIGHVDLKIFPRDSEEPFEIENVAAGFKLWLQLALLEAANRINSYAADLNRTLERGLAEAKELETEEGELPDLSETRSGATYTEATRSLLELPEGFPVEGSSEPYGFDVLNELGVAESPAIDEAVMPLLYLIDEPEQHLHPRLQREAASWIFDTVRGRQSQAVIATHSAAFLSLPSGGGVEHVYLIRRGSGVVAQPFTPEVLRATDLLAEEMGFDRGELLVMTMAFLFVEGVVDQIVIEALLEAALRRKKIAVFSLNSASNAWRIIDAELFRYTTAPIAVLVDKVEPGVVQAMRRDANALEAALRDKGKEATERRAIAKLLRAAQRAERDSDVHVYGLAAHDIFDLLDEQVLKEISGGRFPGHSEGRSAADAAGRPWKTFYQEQYGLTVDAETVRSVVARMRDRPPPPALVEIIDSIEQVTLGRS